MTRKKSLFQRIRLQVFLSLALCLFVGFSVSAQSLTTGSISGTVTDANGAIIPGAAVSIKNSDTGQQRDVLSDEDGRYIAPQLTPGDYEINITFSGFALGTKRAKVNLNENSTVDVTLAPTGASGDVTVSSDDGALVESTKIEASTLVNERAIDSLPLNGRRFHDLAQITPGVSVEPERGQLSMAGQRGINSSINVDGSDYNNPFFGGMRGGERSNNAFTISQDAIHMFQVSRAGFAPEYGRSTGGVVNVITKSGTNDFHGGAFYYLRHREFAPRNILGEETAPIRQQFGGSLGGPLYLPKFGEDGDAVYDGRNRTFFFIVTDLQRERQPLTIRFNATAGLPASILSRQGVFNSTNDINTFLVRVDHRLTENTQLSVRYNQSSNNALNGTFTGSTSGTLDNNGTEIDKTRTLVVGLNSVFSSTLLNEFRGQHSFEDRPRQNNGEGFDFNNVVGPQTQISGCCFLGGVSFLPIVQDDTRLQFSDAMSVLRDDHSFKFGVEYNKTSVNQIFRGNWRGVYIFNTLGNFRNVLNRVPNAVPDQFRAFFGTGEFIASVTEAAAFAQDTWKMTNVTVTGGLRWEGVWNPQPVAPNPLLPQTASIPNDAAQWQPRLGVAWDILGDSRLVARASAGIYYARTPMLLLNQAFNSSGNPNVGVSFTLNANQIRQAQSVHPEFQWPFVPDTSSARNSSFFTGAGIAGLKPDASFFAPDFENPRSFNANMGLEYALSRNLAVALDWVHVNTVHLERIHDVNLFPPVVALDNSSPPQLRPIYNVSVRPNPNFNILRQQESSARSNYDALTVSANKRYSNKHQLTASYTLGFSRDDDSNERNFAGITYQDAFNLAQEYTWSRNDIRHKAVLSGIYDLPWGLQVSGIATLRSGLPFTPFTGVDSNRDSQFTDRPIIGGALLARNSFRQPNFFNADLRVTKSVRFGERHKVSLMVDMFNVINRKNYFFAVSGNESSTTAIGSRWGTGQTPLPTFRRTHLADGRFNTGGAFVAAPFQLQAGLKWTF